LCFFRLPTIYTKVSSRPSKTHEVAV